MSLTERVESYITVIIVLAFVGGAFVGVGAGLYDVTKSQEEIYHGEGIVLQPEDATVEDGFVFERQSEMNGELLVDDGDVFV